MKTGRSAPADVDEYISGFPDEVREILERIRAAIRREAPEAEEGIGYQIPAYRLRGEPLVYFAAFKKHVGIYPAPVGDPEFAGDLSKYAGGKGTAKFPLDGPIPIDLIGEIVRFRMRKNLERAEAKAKKR